MHIASTTHEHASTARVYTYEGDYEVLDSEIRWQAEVRHEEVGTQRFSGTIPVTSPALATVAEPAVRDAIVKRIDSFEDRHSR
jgi:hypothetical protein